MDSIFKACKEGNINEIKRFIRECGNINIQNDAGDTLLHCAIENEHTEICMELINSANTNDLSIDDSTAHLLDSEDDISDPVNTEINVNTVNKKGISPLWLACLYGLTEVVYLLIRKGASFNTEDYLGGYNPIQIAVMNNRTEICNYLLINGCSVETKTSDNITLLHLAAIHGSFETCKLLLDFGTDINSKDVNGNNPMHLAAESTYIDVIVLLLNYNINIYEKNYYGSTPLDIIKNRKSHCPSLKEYEESERTLVCYPLI